MTSHEQRGEGGRVDPRWLLALAFLAGVVVAGGVAGAVALMSDEPVAQQPRQSAEHRPPPKAGDARPSSASGEKPSQARTNSLVPVEAAQGD